MSKKIEKPEKKPNREKTRLNRLEFWKNQPVRFGFISLKPKKPNWTEPKKTEKKPSQTGKKLSQTRKNRARPIWTGFFPKITEPNRNRSVWTDFGFFYKKTGFDFFKKNRTKSKIIIHSKNNKRWKMLF